MMNNRLIILIILIFTIVTTKIYSNNGNDSNKITDAVIPPMDVLLDNSNLGKLFWVTIPQNGSDNDGLTTVGVEIVVASLRATTITCEAQGSLSFTLDVKPGVASSFFANGLNSMEIKDSETILTGKALKLTADQPFSVYVINSKKNSNDGYLAIPVCNWGKVYHSCSYWDYYESPSARGGGFIITASENQTSISIYLKGKNTGKGRTVGNKNIGESITTTLQAGESYMVRGNGATLGTFDISGSKIVASKPIGVVSFHQRVGIPTTSPNVAGDRSCLMEMMPPVQALGKEFVTVQFDRTVSGKVLGYGDFYRIVGTDTNTQFICTYYNKTSGVEIAKWQGVLLNVGDFMEYNQATVPYNYQHNDKSIYGVAHWVATKPVILMQYSYGYGWDKDDGWTPFDITIAPVENYVSNVIFQTPNQLNPLSNQLTLYAYGDPTDGTYALLKSICIDGVPLFQTDPTFLTHKIPETSIYWVKVAIANGTHVITSNTKFSGYLNGNNSNGAYGYPVGMGFNIISSTDNTPPVIASKLKKCGNWTITATETNTGDNGICKIFLYDSSSTNFTLTFNNPDKFRPEDNITSQTFYLTMIDNTLPAKAVFAVTDRSGNVTYDSVVSNPELISQSTQLLSLGTIRIDNSLTGQVYVKNNGLDTINIVKVFLKYDSIFAINDITMPYKLAPSDSMIINVTYTPHHETVSKTAFDSDSLFVNTDCKHYSLAFTGRGIMPHIQFQDTLSFGEAKSGTKYCWEEVNGKGFLIKNTGTDSMLVSDISGVNIPFYIDNPTDPPLPTTIPAGGSIYLKSICFVPSDSLAHQLTVKVVSDAIDDSLLTLIGKGYIPNGVDDIANTNTEKIVIIPNPSFDENIKIIINDNINNRESLEIYNVQGALIQKFDIRNMDKNSLEINSSEFNSGNYYIRYITKESSIIKSFVIIK